jgi:hypothetical protein
VKEILKVWDLFLQLILKRVIAYIELISNSKIYKKGTTSRLELPKDKFYGSIEVEDGSGITSLFDLSKEGKLCLYFGESEKYKIRYHYENIYLDVSWKLVYLGIKIIKPIFYCLGFLIIIPGFIFVFFEIVDSWKYIIGLTVEALSIFSFNK